MYKVDAYKNSVEIFLYLIFLIIIEIIMKDNYNCLYDKLCFHDYIIGFIILLL